MPNPLMLLRNYRLLPGMLAWIIQRLTGLALAFFLLAHIFSIHRLTSGPEAFQEELKMYANPFFKVSEIGLGLAVFLHAFNGLRIVAFDWFQFRSRERHRAFLWAAVALFVLIALPVAALMIKYWLFR